MRLFWWWSDAMKQYASGRIVAIGEDEEAARAAVRSTLGSAYRQHRSGDIFEGWLLQITGEDDAAEWRQWRDKVEADIAKEPEECIALFINGSE